MERTEIKDAIAAYCLGILDPDEKQAVEQLLAGGDAEARKLFAEMQQVVAALPASASARKAPAHLKARVMAAIEPGGKTAATVAPLESRKPRQPEEAARFPILSWAMAAIFFGVCLGLSWYVNSLKVEVTGLKNQLQESKRQVEDLNRDLATQQRIINAVNSPEVRLVNLDGLPPAPEARAHVLVNKLFSTPSIYPNRRTTAITSFGFCEVTCPLMPVSLPSTRMAWPFILWNQFPMRQR